MRERGKCDGINACNVSLFQVVGYGIHYYLCSFGGWAACLASLDSICVQVREMRRERERESFLIARPDLWLQMYLVEDDASLSLFLSLCVSFSLSYSIVLPLFAP